MHLFAPQWFETLPSTNDRLICMLLENPKLPSGTVIATANQTAGRGRYDRVWHSQPGDDLASSILVRAVVPAERVPCLSMAVGVGVSHALDRFGVTTQVKWPNDVLVKERKIAGILSEYIPETGDRERCCAVGIGINVNMPLEDLAAIDRPATSILNQTGQRTELSAVLDALLEALPPFLGKWEKGGFPAFRADWQARDWGLGRHVTVGEDSRKHTGIIRGYGELGELILEDERGNQRRVVFGDVLG
jgi:BirA family biotin operon repressor/biotin-[acetyl-CoA-carboxylase] ligase